MIDIKKEELILKDVFDKIDDMEYFYSNKILNLFHEENISESDFVGTTGYGYNDVGRDKIESIYAGLFGGEDALVRTQIISGTHAITIALFGVLRPNDKILVISGTPYDTLHEVIGLKENPSSLMSFGIKYDEVDLKDNDFDYDAIKEKINGVKVVYIQRSKGYSTRKSLTIDKLERVIKFIKDINKDIIVMVDNCYCELTEKLSPLEVGADIMMGSLIKNMGAGMCNNGGYVIGRKDLVKLAAERLNVPGEAKEVGPSINANKEFLKGLYFAPSVVASALKTAVLTSKLMEDLGYNVEPKYHENRCDIVQNIIFGNEKDLVDFVCSIQSKSAIDSNALVMPTDMPGYDDKIIMASGSFVQGSSIEISCDGPIRPPYIAYMQGSLTYNYGKIAVINAVNKLMENK